MIPMMNAIPLSSAAAGSFWAQPEETVPYERGLRYDGLLDRAVATVPGRDAVVFLPVSQPSAAQPGPPQAAPIRLTYAELAMQADQAARALLATGVTRGSTVAVYASSRPESVVLQFACARIGVALAPVNPAYGAQELGLVLEQAGAAVCFAEPRLRGVDLAASVRAAATSLPGLRSVVWIGAAEPQPGALSWDAWLALGSATGLASYYAARAAAGPDDVIAKMFTSGTTGRPKGVRIRSAAMANGGRFVAERARWEEGVRMLHAMPLFHCGGTISSMASCQAMLGTAIFPPVFSPAVMCAAADAEQATALVGVPTMLIALDQAAQAGGHSMASLRTVMTGGSLVPQAIADHWAARYGVGICNTYGMTETGASAVQTAPDDPAEHLYTTVGRPLPGVSVDIVAPGTAERVPVGAEGEIRLRGWGVMDGYEGDPEATAATLSADGWIRTGDLGALTPDGYLQVTGRLKDLIIRGGENIAAAGVEDAIRTALPEALDVSVVGVPDDYYGEVVAVFIRLRDGASLTEDGTRERLAECLPRHQVPSHVRIVGEFPMTPSGKVQKFILREQFLTGNEQAAAVIPGQH
jgi:acyl-CoA synthetase (AMP-forming)/AMP-acid ligase II